LPHDCKPEQAFCIPLAGGTSACYGSIDVGFDNDETILHVNDSATRGFHNLSDVDMFPIQININGTVLIQVAPDSSIDLQLDVYNSLAELGAIANNVGPGETETVRYKDAQIGDRLFAVVRNVGTSTGNYTVSVVEQQDTP
jgi:hypothetical protein